MFATLALLLAMGRLRLLRVTMEGDRQQVDKITTERDEVHGPPFSDTPLLGGRVNAPPASHDTSSYLIMCYPRTASVIAPPCSLMTWIATPLF